ncbi:SusC/RagA family TonB-linked outer membrane protein [Bacteroidia bacterium]|nr:SusC/RagA family TonB-linked outer membrane protein [Bacteroidia bacterium]
MFLSVTQVWGAITYSQSVSFTFRMNNTSIEDVLNTIEEKSEFRFLYNKKMVNVDQNVDIAARGESIYDVLNNLFQGSDIAYVISDRQIVLNKKNHFNPMVQQQGKRITGTVLDSYGEAVIGANVVEKGTTNGTITDADGKFSLNVSENALLRVTYIGFLAQEIVVGANSNLAITLKEDNQSLDEVVVIGYGTVKKKDLTGAVGSVGGADLVSRKTTQVSQALQGVIPGVMVTRDNNAPGAQATIRIRGVTTIGDSSPLVIVDGMQVDNINDVNPNDIENISVLKDAASSSIYGSQAAAGVILISTKRAQAEQFNIEYNYEYGMEIPTESPDFVNVIRYMQMTNETRWNDAGNTSNEFPTYSKDVIDNYYQLNRENPDKYPNTDWNDLIFRSSAPRQSHIIKVTGGNSRIRTAASFAYDNVEAIYDNRSYERFTSRVNNDLTINKYLAASIDVSFKRTIDKQPNTGLDIVRFGRFSPPVYAATWADGRYAEGKTGDNVYGQLHEGGFRNSWYNQLGAKIGLDFTPVKGLKISGVFSPVFNNTKQKNWKKSVPWYLSDDPTVQGGFIQQPTNLSEVRNDDYRMTTQFLANYDTNFGSHSLNLMAGYEDRYEFNENLGASRNNYELDSYPYLNIGPLELRDNSGSAYEYARQSVFGRVMYNYNNKYLLQANVRYDGSSRFASDYRWGVFPSVSLGWVLSEENFMKDITPISFLKLRASYGTLGNERIGNYPYQATMAFANAIFFQGTNIVSQQGAAQQRYAIRDITWETTESYDIGVDAYFLDNRLRFAGDYYKKNTKDMLLALQIPTFMGYDNPDQNTGKMHTTGWEIDLAWSDKIGDLGYSIGFNLSDFKSVMGDLGGTEFLGDQIKIKGSEFNEWYGYRTNGLFQTAQEVAGSALISSNTKPGDVHYVDVSGADGKPDNRISPENDRVLLGGSLPRYTYGGNIRLDYKSWDLGITFQGVGKQNARIEGDMVRPLLQNWMNMPQLIDGNYYSQYNTAEQNLAAKYPRLTVSDPGNNYALSDYWLFNGRYFRLKNINLGYTLPTQWVNKVAMQNVRLYASVSDLFCLNQYPKGYDPESGINAYPITTTVLFGVSVKF